MLEFLEFFNEWCRSDPRSLLLILIINLEMSGRKQISFIKSAYSFVAAKKKEVIPASLDENELNTAFSQFLASKGCCEPPIPLLFKGVTDVEGDGSCFFHAIMTSLGKDMTYAGSRALRMQCLNFLSGSLFDKKCKPILLQFMSMDIAMKALKTCISKKVVIALDFTLGRGSVDDKVDSFLRAITLYCSEDFCDLPDAIALAVSFTWQQYCKIMASDKTYADDVMAFAACHVLDTQIIVAAHQASEPLYVRFKGEESRPYSRPAIFLLLLVFPKRGGHYLTLTTDPLYPNPSLMLLSSAESTITSLTPRSSTQSPCQTLSRVPCSDPNPNHNPATIHAVSMSSLITNALQCRLAIAVQEETLHGQVSSFILEAATSGDSNSTDVFNFVYVIKANLTCLRLHLYSVSMPYIFL